MNLKSLNCNHKITHKPLQGLCGREAEPHIRKGLGWLGAEPLHGAEPHTIKPSNHRG